MILTSMAPNFTTAFVKHWLFVKKLNSHLKIICNSVILQYFLVSVSKIASKSKETSEEHVMMTSFF